MDHHYRITYYFKNKPSVSEDAISLEDARARMIMRMRTDPDCCANIVIKDLDSKTNKHVIRMEAYAYVDGHIVRTPF